MYCSSETSMLVERLSEVETVRIRRSGAGFVRVPRTPTCSQAGGGVGRQRNLDGHRNGFRKRGQRGFGCGDRGFSVSRWLRHDWKPVERSGGAHDGDVIDPIVSVRRDQAARRTVRMGRCRRPARRRTSTSTRAPGPPRTSRRELNSGACSPFRIMSTRGSIRVSD